MIVLFCMLHAIFCEELNTEIQLISPKDKMSYTANFTSKSLQVVSSNWETAGPDTISHEIVMVNTTCIHIIQIC